MGSKATSGGIYDETGSDFELARWDWEKWVLYVKRWRARKLSRGVDCVREHADASKMSQ